jgi:dihydropteroate synthase
VDEVAAELNEQLGLLDTLLPRWLQITDPGIGFAKGCDENMALLKPHNLRRLGSLLGNRPLLIGVSRKRFLTALLEKERSDILSRNTTDRTIENTLSLDVDINDRDMATSGACCAAIMGGAHFLRVHNVQDVVSVCAVFSRVMFH